MNCWWSLNIIRKTLPYTKCRTQYVWEEWLSGLRRYIHNMKVPISNSAARLPVTLGSKSESGTSIYGRLLWKWDQVNFTQYVRLGMAGELHHQKNCLWTCFFYCIRILTYTNYEKSRFLLTFFFCECLWDTNFPFITPFY